MPHTQPDSTWDQVSSLFEALVDLPPAERQARLRDAALPAEVVAEVEALLAASEDDAYLAKSPVPGVAGLCQAALEEAAAQQRFYPGLMLLNRYILEKEVAGGGQSVVYSARDLKFENRPLVAIKIYLHTASPHTMDLFRREASALAEIESSGCVGVRDHGELDSGQPFLVMDWINGVTLQSKLKDGPLALPLADSILSKVAMALDEAHRKKIIHRDLKPSNIILRDLPEGQVEPVLIDFGIARSGDPAAAGLTGVISGTAPYMAPEQWTGGSSQASDQYSLALVICEMLAGKRLTDGGWEAIPAKVRPVLQKALAKEPEQRYARVLDFSNAFGLAARPKPKVNRWVIAASLILALGAGGAVVWDRLHPVAPTPRVSYTIQATDGGKFLRLSLSSTQPGFLYLVGEDPEGLGVLYPFLSGGQTSAALQANRPILVPPAGKNSIETEDPSKPDTFWIVWSREDPAELRELANRAQAEVHGLVKDPATVARVRDYLRRHRATTSHEASAVFSAASSLAYPIAIRNGREIEGTRVDSTLLLPGGKKMKPTLLAVAAVNLALAQAPEEATRRLWSNEFAGNRPPAAQTADPKPAVVKAAAAKAVPADYTYLGVTLWRDRPTKPADPEHARAIVFGKRMTAERVDSATVLRQGDSLQIAVESARAGYLYVINREVYRDKSKGQPMLIFPHRDIKKGANRIEPGVQVLIPDGERFQVRRDREDLVGEELTFLVSPKPLGVIAEGEALELPVAKVAEWEKLWKTSQKSIESTGKGAVVTPAEIKAREEGVPLTAQDALPHTMFRVDSKAGAPVLVSLQLNFGNKATR